MLDSSVDIRDQGQRWLKLNVFVVHTETDKSTCYESVGRTSDNGQAVRWQNHNRNVRWQGLLP